jgi:hypothetical protein
MTPHGFAIFCLVGFLLPVPILAWLDRSKRRRGAETRREPRG